MNGYRVIITKEDGSDFILKGVAQAIASLLKALNPHLTAEVFEVKEIES